MRHAAVEVGRVAGLEEMALAVVLEGDLPVRTYMSFIWPGSISTRSGGTLDPRRPSVETTARTLPRNRPAASTSQRSLEPSKLTTA